MTNRSEIESRLQKAGIRPTAVRILIMDALGKLDRPISSLELEMRLDTVDRSSISQIGRASCRERVYGLV